MTHRIPTVRPARLLAAVLAAVAMLALGPHAAGAAAATKLRDISYLAHGPDGLHLAVVVHAGRLEAYACDGTSRKAYFGARARSGRRVLRSRAGDRLALRLGARRVAARLTLKGGTPLALTARRARAAIFTTTVRPDGAVFGTAAGGVLGAHLSGLGLVGALALPDAEPRAFAEAGFAAAPLFVDGRPVAYPPDRAAEALQGEWWWIVTPRRIVGATTQVLDLGNPWGIAAGTKFIDNEGDL